MATSEPPMKGEKGEEANSREVSKEEVAKENILDTELETWGDEAKKRPAKNGNLARTRSSDVSQWKFLGEELLKSVKEREKGTTKGEAVKGFVATSDVLTGARDRYAFFQPMLIAVVENKLRRLKNVGAKAEELEDKDGKDIGEGLAKILAFSTNPQAAVDEWRLQFPALIELDKEYNWFRPLLEAMSFKLLEQALWGVKMRVTAGALASISDMLTDIYVTFVFAREGKGGFFKASLATILVAIFIQTWFVFHAYRKLGAMRVLKEWAPVLVALKPAVDGYRVATGAEHEVGVEFEPMLQVRGDEREAKWRRANRVTERAGMAMTGEHAPKLTPFLHLASVYSRESD